MAGMDDEGAEDAEDSRENYGRRGGGLGKSGGVGGDVASFDGLIAIGRVLSLQLSCESGLVGRKMPSGKFCHTAKFSRRKP